MSLRPTPSIVLFVAGFVTLIAAAYWAFGASRVTASVAAIGTIIAVLNALFGRKGRPEPLQNESARLFRLSAFTRLATAVCWLTVLVFSAHALRLTPFSEFPVKGYIEDAGGRSVTGFSVNVKPQRGGEHRVVSDARGEFSVAIRRSDITDGVELHWTNEGVPGVERLTFEDIVAGRAAPIRLKPTTASLNIAYYRFKGIAAALLVRGHVAPEWKDVLGGKYFIVPNAVFTVVRDFLRRFGEPVTARFIAGGVDEAAGREEELTKPFGVDSYRGGESNNDQNAFWIPDVNANHSFFETLEWPRGYELTCNDFDFNGRPKASDRESGLPPPTLWRYATAADFRDYRNRGRQLLGVDVSEGNVVRSLTYLAQRGMPPGFLVVYGRAGLHGGWDFQTDLRQLEVFVAVIRNTSERAVTIQQFNIASMEDGLRAEGKTTAALVAAERTTDDSFSGRQIVPGEQIIVPLRMQFGHGYAAPRSEDDEQVAECLRGWKAWRERTASITDVLEFGIDLDGGKSIRKRAPAPVVTEPDVRARFDFGPAIRIVSWVISGVEQPARQYDPANIWLYAGREDASCPFVFSYVGAHRAWLNEGVVFPDAVGHSRKRVDVVRLQHFNGRVRISELENEISVIDYVALRTTRSDGAQTVLLPADPTLTGMDGIERDLHRGDYLEITFAIPSGALDNARVELLVGGYYLPYGSAEFRKRLAARGESRS